MGNDLLGGRPAQVAQPRRELAVREGRHVLAEIERLACGDQPQDDLGEGGVPGAVEHLTDVVGQPVDQVPRFGCREVADDVPFDHLLQGVGDGRVESGGDRGLEASLLVRHRQGVGLEDQGGAIRRPEQGLAVGAERCFEGRGVLSGVQRDQGRCEVGDEFLGGGGLRG